MISLQREAAAREAAEAPATQPTEPEPTAPTEPTEPSEAPTPQDASPEATQTMRDAVDLDEIPIELVTLSDSFIESLTAPVHPTPPSIDRLHRLFQDFYAQASAHISTHLAALASHESRSRSRSARPPLLQRLSAASAPTPAPAPAPASDQPPLSSDDAASRKKALRAKQTRLEEAVERRICEGIYFKIYRHRSTHDQAADDKLRSRAAALALVGISPADLGIALGAAADADADARLAREREIKAGLEDARQGLRAMHESCYPLGKLNQLKATHRAIVETLAHFHSSSGSASGSASAASADEILPMLIYTLITMAPADLHVISDMHFIQTFRWEHKLTGEAAYCLTNLEAAIGFLETVDLSTLRADEHPSGPPKVPGATALGKASTFPPAYVPGLVVTGSSSAAETTPVTVGAAAGQSRSGSRAGSRAASPVPSASSSLLAGLSRPARTRTLSDLANTPATAAAMGVASEILTTADQGLKNISTSLGDSYKFFIGRLREPNTGGAGHNGLVVPKTLEEARRLMSATPPPYEQAGDGSKPVAALEDKVLDLIGGGRSKSRSGSGSGSGSGGVTVGPGKDGVLSSSPSNNNTAMLESMRSLGSSFNPMARLSSIGGFRGFGRTVSGGDGTVAAAAAAAAVATGPATATATATATTTTDTVTVDAPVMAKIPPPIKRFVDMQNPGDMKLSEVLDLLRDYRRLATALEQRGAFST